MPVWLLAFRLKLILEKLIELTMVGNLGSNGRHRTLVLRIVAAREKNIKVVVWRGLHRGSLGCGDTTNR